MMHIAIFADVHGRVELCFRLCARWQRETGHQIDFILQAGDLGAFFDRARLDRATIRYAQNDPAEAFACDHRRALAEGVWQAYLAVCLGPYAKICAKNR